MPLVEPDGSLTDDQPIAQDGKSVWRVPRTKLYELKGDGSNAIVLETVDTRLELEQGGDHLIVPKELYVQMVGELSAFKDSERRALAWYKRRDKSRRERS